MVTTKKKKTAPRKAGSPIRVVDGSAYGARKLDHDRCVAYYSDLPIEDLAPWCESPRRIDDPARGFQRGLDERRVVEMAAYLDSGMPIPGQIVLAVQPGAHLEYSRGGKSITFRRIEGAFEVIDGQHRLAAYLAAATKRRVPVVIYEGMDRATAARMFIDVNSKAKGVPPALLADIREIAQIESEIDGELRKLYDELAAEPRSPLHGRTSPAGTEPGKLTRVTFNTSYRWLFTQRDGTNIGRMTKGRASLFVAYLRAWSAALGGPEALLRPAVFGAVGALIEDFVKETHQRCGRPTEAALTETVAVHAEPMRAKADGTRRTKAGMVADVRTSLRGAVPLDEVTDAAAE